MDDEDFFAERTAMTFSTGELTLTKYSFRTVANRPWFSHHSFWQMTTNLKPKFKKVK
jgi:hypothetical protein